jgi:hypothetical protein
MCRPIGESPCLSVSFHLPHFCNVGKYSRNYFFKNSFVQYWVILYCILVRASSCVDRPSIDAEHAEQLFPISKSVILYGNHAGHLTHGWLLMTDWHSFSNVCNVSSLGTFFFNTVIKAFLTLLIIHSQVLPKWRTSSGIKCHFIRLLRNCWLMYPV